MFPYILLLCKTAVIITAKGQILVSGSITHRTAFQYQYNLKIEQKYQQDVIEFIIPKFTDIPHVVTGRCKGHVGYVHLLSSF
jgi:hypothetical protein